MEREENNYASYQQFAELSIEKDALVYGKSFSILDYALGSEPVGIIAKLLLSLYVLKYDGKTS